MESSQTAVSTLPHAALARWNRGRVFAFSRGVTCVLVAASLGSFLWTPSNGWEVAADILLRSYLLFLCCVMAHEASHGHLGRTRAGNLWWGRFAQLSTTVPNISFRMTHSRHHLHTNEPDLDPDHFMKPRHWLEIPVRSILLPHIWLLWLLRRGLLRRRDTIEYVAHYVLMGAIYGGLAWLVGPARVAIGLFPALAVLSFVLWYQFAVKTHEGYSTGSQEARSHDYYGSAIYWLTLGLSMHRVHHLRPDLAWMEIAPAARNQGGTLLDRLLMRRDVRS